MDNGKALPAKSTQEIRDLLGIKASDNLTNASYVLVVEGADDVIALRALLSHLSESLKKLIDSHMLIFEEIGGAGNLPYKLTSLKNSLCVYHCFLDNDEAGRSAYKSAEKDNLLSIILTTLVNCNGSRNAELEDCFNLELYKGGVIDEFGVDLSCREFRGNAKWSDRIQRAFLSQGKPWNKGVKSKVSIVLLSMLGNPQRSH